MWRAAVIAYAIAAGPALAAPPLPFDLGGSFELVDQTGAQRSEVNPDGKPQLLFFGYANCQQICSVALPLMAEAVDALAEKGVGVTPVMITVDPARDTVETIGPPLEALHESFVGLTGSETALSTAYDAFSVEHSLVYEDPLEGPVYAHGSFVYLLDAEGTFLTLLPPILSADRVTELVLKYTQ